MARPRVSTAQVKLIFRSKDPGFNQEKSLDSKLIEELNQLTAKLGHEWVEETLKGIVRDVFLKQRFSLSERKLPVDELVDDDFEVQPSVNVPRLGTPAFNDD